MAFLFVPAKYLVDLMELHMAISKFVKEANYFIQWLISNVFLFVPAKLLMEGCSGTTPKLFSTTTVIEFLLALESVLQDIFTPTVFFYADEFYLGARIFKKPKTRFLFELVSLVIGGIAFATLEALLFVGRGAWEWTAGALGVFIPHTCGFQDLGMFPLR